MAEQHHGEHSLKKGMLGVAGIVTAQLPQVHTLQ
jgi:hypothetical protein